MSYNVIASYPPVKSRITVEVVDYPGSEDSHEFEVWLDNYRLLFDVKKSQYSETFAFMKRFIDAALNNRYVEVDCTADDTTFSYITKNYKLASRNIDNVAYINRMGVDK